MVAVLARALSWARAAGTGLGPRLSNVTQGLAAAVGASWGGDHVHGAGSAGLRRIRREGWGRTGQLRSPLRGGLAQGTTWAGTGLRGEVEGEVVGPGTGRPAGRAHVNPAPTGDGQPQSPGKFHGGLGRHPGAQAGLQPEGLGQVGNGHCLLVVAGQGDRGQRAGSASCWTRMVSGALGTIFGPSEPQFAHLETGIGAATPRGSCDIGTGHS